MAKVKEVFVCQSCGTPSPKWQGQCAGCGEWNTLVAEVRSGRIPGPRAAARSGRADAAGLPCRRGGRRAAPDLHRIRGARPGARRRSGGRLGDFDRRRSRNRQVDPDAAIGRRTRRRRAGPVRDRGGVDQAGGAARAAPGARASRPPGWSPRPRSRPSWRRRPSLKARALIVDSIQTMYSQRIDTAPGAVSQLRECTAELVRFAKASGTAVLLVGHVTKEGQIAGPRVLEHMVDTVLYFESDTGQPLPGPAVGEESLRRRQRDRRVRDGRAGIARSHQPLGDFPVAPSEGPCRAA